VQSIDATSPAAPPGPAPADGGATVAADSFLTLRYRLSGPDGAAVVDTFGGAPATLSLGTGELAPSLEARLIGLRAGARRTFALAPGEAFGARSDALVQRLSRAALAEATGDADEVYAVGDVVRFPMPESPGGGPGGGGTVAGIVRAIDAGAVVFDFNHPLAGRAATFEVELLAVL
jgi:FKBP-type peptidyl-prolyl cis-trans isomerase SlpA